jgi:hypothetical protein
VFGASAGVAAGLRRLPSTSYWQPPELSLATQPGPARYLVELARLRGLARRAHESYIAGNPPSFGILTLWRSGGRPEVQIANVHEVILEPVPHPHTYTLLLSRRELRLSHGAYLLHDLFSGAILHPTASNAAQLTYRVRVAAHDSRLFEVIAPGARRARPSSILPRQVRPPQ